MSFKKGDLMYTTCKDEGGWCFARARDTGRDGYFPTHYLAEYKSVDTEE